jgi:hypothetical protein
LGPEPGIELPTDGDTDSPAAARHAAFSLTFCAGDNAPMDARVCTGVIATGLPMGTDGDAGGTAGYKPPNAGVADATSARATYSSSDDDSEIRAKPGTPLLQSLSAHCGSSLAI